MRLNSVRVEGSLCVVTRKSEIESLILTADREFKYRAVNFLNNIAFNSEKVTVSSIADAKSTLEKNPRVLNVIIDGELFASNIDTYFTEGVKTLFTRQDVIGIMYLSEKLFKDFKHHNHNLPNLVVDRLPFDKRVFTEVFHKRSSLKDVSSAKTGQEAPPSKNPFARLENVTATSNQEDAAAKSKKSVSVSAFEASEHVRDTISMINIIGKNREAFEQMKVVGQKFNGVVGAFAFFPNLSGYTELSHLGHIIDRISRHYDEMTKKEKISDEHFNLLLDAAKCSFLLLMALREQKPVPAEFTDTEKKIMERFKASGIEDAKKVSQSEIDELLKGAS